MFNKISVCVCLFVLSFGYLFSQVAGVTRSGDKVKQDAVFLDQYGGEVDHPRLSCNGKILYYPPFLVFDSMRVVSPDAAMFYAKVPFDGWSPVLSRGFEYTTNESMINPEQLCVPGTLGSFEAEVFGSLPNRTYYVRPFATNAYGTTRGEVSSFRTGPAPVVLDTMFTEVVTPTSINVRTEVVSNGGVALSGRMIAFSDDEYQDTVAVNVFKNVAGNYFFTTFSGLTPATDYFFQVVLTNGRYSDTLELHARTLSDLVLTVESNRNPETPLCQNGNTITYNAVLTGTDVHKPLYHYKWISSTGTESSSGDVFDVYYDTEGTYKVTAVAFYEEDTLTTTYTQVILPQEDISSFYVCTNEFINTADVTTTNIASIRWIDEDNRIVATTRNVKLPTGYYTVECTDINGCVLEKEVYVGKKKLSCVVSTPGSNESARYEDGVWKIDSLCDVDGNWYAVTQIGNTCWIRQNLRARHEPTGGADILGSGQSYSPDMRYLGDVLIKDADEVICEGGYYNWPAAFNYSSSSVTQQVEPGGHQGICPQGWHLPRIADLKVVVDSMLNLCCAGMDIIPSMDNWDETRSSFLVAQNTPIQQMLQKSCYESYSNPAYNKEIYDASNLSIFPPNAVEKFWLGDIHSVDNTAYALKLPISNQGLYVGVGTKSGSFFPVRCVRNY